MRHVYIRIIISLIWLAAVFVSGISGNLENAAFYAIPGAVILYSAYAAWKREKDSRKDS